MNELGVQKWLINDFKKEYRDAVAYKQSHRFLAGVPDLRLASKKTGEWNIEVKYLDRPPRGETAPIELTTLQRVWGRKADEAGMGWAWCLVIREGYEGYWISAGRNWDAVQEVIAGMKWKARGQGWKHYDLIRQAAARPV